MNTVSIEKSRKTAVLSVRTISMTAMLSAVAYLLAFVEFPVPLSPSFARMDLSDLPALIGAFAFGPLSGLLIELVKNALQLLTTSTGGIGEIANFLMGAAYVVTAGFIYKRHKTKKTALARLRRLPASLWASAAALANYFILLPLFENFHAAGSAHRLLSPSSCPSSIPSWMWCCSMRSPLIMLKGLVIGGVTMLIYKKLAHADPERTLTV